MTRLVFPIWRLLADRAGHTAIDYSMIAAFIALGLIGLLASIGLSVESMFTPLLPAFAGNAG